MKKSIFFVISLILLAVVITSCKKDEKTNEPFVNGSATIKGTALINLDLTNDTIGTVYENVPSGTNIYAVINSKDLVEFPSINVNYGDIMYTTQVGANGEFIFTIPANNNTVTVKFSSDDFESNQLQADSTEISKIFNLPDGISENVHNGVLKLLKVHFAEK